MAASLIKQITLKPATSINLQDKSLKIINDRLTVMKFM